MPDLIRRYGLDRWGPLTFALLILVAVIAVTVAVLIIVTRPSVDEVIRAAQAIGTAAIALGAPTARTPPPCPTRRRRARTTSS
jgi:hypothetical protein